MELTDEILNQIIKDLYFEKSNMKHDTFYDLVSSYFCKIMTKNLDSEDLDISADILMDIYTQWNIYLADTYSESKFKKINLDNIILPNMYFGLWYRQINNESLGLANRMGWKLQEEVERRLIIDLNHYRTDCEKLHFNWSNSCIEGHSIKVKSGIIENFSNILLIDYYGNVRYSGSINFIFEEKVNYFFEVYWDYLQGEGFGKSKYGIPVHIWEKLPGEIKDKYKERRMK